MLANASAGDAHLMALLDASSVAQCSPCNTPRASAEMAITSSAARSHSVAAIAVAAVAAASKQQQEDASKRDITMVTSALSNSCVKVGNALCPSDYSRCRFAFDELQKAVDVVKRCDDLSKSLRYANDEITSMAIASFSRTDLWRILGYRGTPDDTRFALKKREMEARGAALRKAALAMFQPKGSEAPASSSAAHTSRSMPSAERFEESVAHGGILVDDSTDMLLSVFDFFQELVDGAHTTLDVLKTPLEGDGRGEAPVPASQKVSPATAATSAAPIASDTSASNSNQATALSAARLKELHITPLVAHATEDREWCVKEERSFQRVLVLQCLVLLAIQQVEANLHVARQRLHTCLTLQRRAERTRLNASSARTRPPTPDGFECVQKEQDATVPGQVDARDELVVEQKSSLPPSLETASLLLSCDFAEEDMRQCIDLIPQLTASIAEAERLLLHFEAKQRRRFHTSVTESVFSLLQFNREVHRWNYYVQRRAFRHYNAKRRTFQSCYTALYQLEHGVLSMEKNPDVFLKIQMYEKLDSSITLARCAKEYLLRYTKKLCEMDKIERVERLTEDDRVRWTVDIFRSKTAAASATSKRGAVGDKKKNSAARGRRASVSSNRSTGTSVSAASTSLQLPASSVPSRRTTSASTTRRGSASSTNAPLSRRGSTLSVGGESTASLAQEKRRWRFKLYEEARDESRALQYESLMDVESGAVFSAVQSILDFVKQNVSGWAAAKEESRGRRDSTAVGPPSQGMSSLESNRAPRNHWLRAAAEDTPNGAIDEEVKVGARRKSRLNSGVLPRRETVVVDVGAARKHSTASLSRLPTAEKPASFEALPRPVVYALTALLTTASDLLAAAEAEVAQWDEEDLVVNTDDDDHDESSGGLLGVTSKQTSDSYDGGALNRSTSSFSTALSHASSMGSAPECHKAPWEAAEQRISAQSATATRIAELQTTLKDLLDQTNIKLRPFVKRRKQNGTPAVRDTPGATPISPQTPALATRSGSAGPRGLPEGLSNDKQENCQSDDDTEVQVLLQGRRKNSGKVPTPFARRERSPAARHLGQDFRHSSTPASTMTTPATNTTLSAVATYEAKVEESTSTPVIVSPSVALLRPVLQDLKQREHDMVVLRLGELVVPRRDWGLVLTDDWLDRVAEECVHSLRRFGGSNNSHYGGRRVDSHSHDEAADRRPSPQQRLQMHEPFWRKPRPPSANAPASDAKPPKIPSYTEQQQVRQPQPPGESRRPPRQFSAPRPGSRPPTTGSQRGRDMWDPSQFVFANDCPFATIPCVADSNGGLGSDSDGRSGGPRRDISTAKSNRSLNVLHTLNHINLPTTLRPGTANRQVQQTAHLMLAPRPASSSRAATRWQPPARQFR